MQFNSFERRVIDHVTKTPRPGRSSAKSALRHLERAYKLSDEMPEIAIFLGITAEEEAATAVFHSLKRRKYEGARELNYRSHVHKAALLPFVLAIGKRLDTFPQLRQPIFLFDTKHSPDKQERLRLRFTIDGPDGPLWLYPLPPLELSARTNGEALNFAPELAEIAKEKNAESILRHVEDLANRRNLVLYAGAKGMPVIDSAAKFLAYRRWVVFAHLVTYLLIDAYPEKQAFAQQALDALLTMLRSPRARKLEAGTAE